MISDRIERSPITARVGLNLAYAAALNYGSGRAVNYAEAVRENYNDVLSGDSEFSVITIRYEGYVNAEAVMAASDASVVRAARIAEIREDAVGRGR